MLTHNLGPGTRSETHPSSIQCPAIPERALALKRLCIRNSTGVGQIVVSHHNVYMGLSADSYRRTDQKGG